MERQIDKLLRKITIGRNKQILEYPKKTDYTYWLEEEEIPLIDDLITELHTLGLRFYWADVYDDKNEFITYRLRIYNE